MPERTTELIVRTERPGDREFALSLSAKAFSPYSKNPKAFVERMIDDPGSVLFVAELGSTQVGFALVRFLELGRPFGPWARPVLARVDAIAVRPDAQGRGVGHELLARVEDEARERGAALVSATTAATNRRARRLFASAGFFATVALGPTYDRGQIGIALQKAL